MRYEILTTDQTGNLRNHPHCPAIYVRDMMPGALPANQHCTQWRTNKKTNTIGYNRICLQMAYTLIAGTNSKSNRMHGISVMRMWFGTERGTETTSMWALVDSRPMASQ